MKSSHGVSHDLDQPERQDSARHWRKPGAGPVDSHAAPRSGSDRSDQLLPDPEGHNQRRAEEAVRSLKDRAFAVAADVRASGDVTRMFDEIITRTGQLDIVVNNAAVIRDRTLRKMTDAEWQDVIDTNLTGVFQVCRAAAARMQDGGRIVNMASISGVVGFYGQVNYSAAKAGVIAITKVLSKELARRNITVNAVAPAWS